MSTSESFQKNTPTRMKGTKQQQSPNVIDSKDKRNTVAIILLIIMLALSVYFANGAIVTGANALKDSYDNAYSSEKESAYQSQYKKYYDKAEKEYHVSNRVSISIGDLRETAALEVLNVSDIEYIIEDGSDNKYGITSWLEVPGIGTFIINLQASEFIVDEERLHVLVRTPYPELTNISIDYANVQKLLFENDMFNDNYKIGEEKAKEQLSAADLLIKKEFASNQHFYLSAQNAAIDTIQCLVKRLNPGVQDLSVDVEFY